MIIIVIDNKQPIPIVTFKFKVNNTACNKINTNPPKSL